MNTTLKGNQFEETVYNAFLKMISSEEIYIPKNSHKIYRKKKYYSKDRDDFIEFDIAVEIYIPGHNDYSMLILIECKNYSSPISVDNIEEFYSKVRQVSGANVKAIFASNNSLQKSAYNFALSKGIAFLRLFDESNFKWELHRQESLTGAFSFSQEEIIQVIMNEDYVSSLHKYFAISKNGATNSLISLYCNLLDINTEDSKKIILSSNNTVPYISRNQLEEISDSFLAESQYLSGRVRIDPIHKTLNLNYNYKIVTDYPRPEGRLYDNAIGRVIFYDKEIHIFENSDLSPERMRFTIAHEISHVLLNHGNFIDREIYDLSDEDLRNILNPISEIGRIELQANYLAGALLMPKRDFENSFEDVLMELDIHDKGHGRLYIDNQSENIRNGVIVISFLASKYGVSKGAASYRLSQLGLLKDVRKNSKSSFKNMIKGFFK